jgi:hypothetical protein
MKHGIFVVEVDDGNHVTIIDRYVLVAETAAEAAWKAGRAQWPTASEPQLESMLADDRVTVGRLGDYDPGITGARMSRGAVIAIQRIGAR